MRVQPSPLSAVELVVASAVTIEAEAIDRRPPKAVEMVVASVAFNTMSPSANILINDVETASAATILDDALLAIAPVAEVVASAVLNECDPVPVGSA